jgi:Tfp pilus assembly protein PilF
MPTRLEALLKFLEDDPSDSFTRYAVGLEYIKEGNIGEGERCLLETIERDPAYIPAYHQLGQFYARQARDDDAVAMYIKGIKAAAAYGDSHALHEMQQELQELQDGI